MRFKNILLDNKLLKVRSWKGVCQSQSGFTLVEFLVIALILVTVSGIIVGVIVSVLRGSSRSYHSVEVSSNGNFALSVISSLLASAEKVESVDGTAVTDCVTPRTGQSIRVRGSDGGFTTIACVNESISSNSASLIDVIELRVPAGSCSFTCSQSTSFDKPLIDVEFEIESRTFDFPTDRSEEFFRSSVSMRNYVY